MSQGVRICKVCGKEYPYCKTNRGVGIFRWQDVACCPEHGSIYFDRIAESRSQNAVSSDAEETDVAVSASVEDSDEGYELFEEEPDDEEDELFEEGFDDEEESEIES